MGKIRVATIGLGNRESSLTQGVEFYEIVKEDELTLKNSNGLLPFRPAARSRGVYHTDFDRWIGRARGVLRVGPKSHRGKEK